MAAPPVPAPRMLYSDLSILQENTLNTVLERGNEGHVSTQVMRAWEDCLRNTLQQEVACKQQQEVACKQQQQEQQ